MPVSLSPGLSAGIGGTTQFARQAGRLQRVGLGRVMVYDVADEAELRDILAKDPYTPADVYEIAALNESQPLFPFSD